MVSDRENTSNEIKQLLLNAVYLHEILPETIGELENARDIVDAIVLHSCLELDQFIANKKMRKRAHHAGHHLIFPALLGRLESEEIG